MCMFNFILLKYLSQRQSRITFKLCSTTRRVNVMLNLMKIDTKDLLTDSVRICHGK